MLLIVPNVSEGRNAQTVAHIAGRASRTVLALDCSSDADHNRSVLWLAGTRDDLVDASVGIARRAAEHIDLRGHRGAHPRVGALDVLPFVGYDEPIAAAVEAAGLAAARIAADLGIPVYLYGAAAADDRPLPAVRTSFERLGAGLENAAVPPDLGPGKLHPTAGAVCVGARGPLVAFNVALRDATVALARDIAGAVREAAGGLPGVRALGLALASRGLVQVSMNLVEPARTGPRDAFDRVAALARAAGAEAIEAEVIGLVPDAVLPELEDLPLARPVRSVGQALAEATRPTGPEAA